jgi:hypothetical protein
LTLLIGEQPMPRAMVAGGLRCAERRITLQQ